MKTATKLQIAETLNHIASHLLQDADGDVPPELARTISELESLVASMKFREKETDSVNSPFKVSKRLDENSLAAHIARIKSSKEDGRPMSEEFRSSIANRDRTGCIAAIAFEDLWTGEGGWKLPDTFWDMAIYVWKNVPEFFAKYDSDRAIEEDTSKWTQGYFDEQRNYLRHNFCLERLCHLIMVYEFLHGPKIKEPRTASRPFQSPSASEKTAPSKRDVRNNHLGLKISLGIGTLVACLMAYMLGERDAKSLARRCGELDEMLSQSKASLAIAKKQVDELGAALQHCEEIARRATELNEKEAGSASPSVTEKGSAQPMEESPESIPNTLEPNGVNGDVP